MPRRDLQFYVTDYFLSHLSFPRRPERRLLRLVVRLSGPPTIHRTIRSADLLDLSVFEFDRRRPAENGNCHFEPFPLFIHFLDEPVEGSERTIGDANLLADLETDR